MALYESEVGVDLNVLKKSQPASHTHTHTHTHKELLIVLNKCADE